jgi:hypothetical protein
MPPRPLARTSHSRSRRRLLRESRRRGMGLIDCLISIVVISLSSFGFLAASMASSRLEVESRAVAVAVELTRDVLEELQATPLDEIVARFNDDPEDDPDGVGTARGSAFLLDTRRALSESVVQTDYRQEEAEVVDGSNTIPEKMECSVRLPILIDGSGLAELTEESVLPEFGLPADLNGDGEIDGDNRLLDFHVLPIVVRMEWPTLDGGRRTLDFAAVLGGRGYR